MSLLSTQNQTIDDELLQNPDQGVIKLMQALREHESGGNYEAKGASGEYGAFQFMPATWKNLSKKYLGQENAEMTKANQNQVAYKYIFDLKNQGYTPAQVASIWNSGSPDWEGKVGVNKAGVKYDTPSYVRNVLGKIGQTISNIPASGVEVVKNIGTAIGGFFSPRQIKEPEKNPLIATGQAIGSLMLGGLMKAGVIPKEKTTETQFQAITQFFKDRYGSKEALEKTITEDPVGFAMDISAVVGGGGAILKGAGEVSKIGLLEKAGTTLERTGAAIEPFSATTKLVGKGVQSTGETVAKFMAGPFANKIDLPVIEASQRLGVKLPASAKSISKIVPQLEALEAKSIFGGKIPELVKNSQIQLNNIADRIIKATNQLPDLSLTGKSIIEGMNNFREVFNKTKDLLYQSVEKAKNLKASTNYTEEALESIIKNKEAVLGGTSDLKFFRDKLQSILNNKVDFIAGKELQISEKLTFNNLKQTRTDIGQKLASRFDPFVTGNKAILEKLYAALSKDLDITAMQNNPSLAQQIQEANTFYSQGLEKLNSAYGKKIYSLRNQSDKIVPALFNSATSIEDIPRIFEIIGKENIPAVQSSLLEQLFKKAQNADGNFTPTGLTREMNKLGKEKLQIIFSPEQYQALNDIETVAKSFEKLGKITEGSQTAFLVRILGPIGTFGINPEKWARWILGEKFFAKFIASPTGQQWLLTGKGAGGGVGKYMQRFGKRTPSPIQTGFQTGRIQQEEFSK
jgi:hypothetical protein